MSASAWSTIASLATAVGTLVVSPDRAPELGWMATASRHWNIDRPDPR